MNEFKEKLLEMRRVIIEQINEDNRQSVNSVTMEVGDEVDHAGEEAQREYYQLLSNREAKKLKQINTALGRIDSEEYGICESCDEEISAKRLHAIPFAKLCTDCQSSYEVTNQTQDLDLGPYDKEIYEND